MDSVSDRISDRFLLAAFGLEMICVAVAVDTGDGAVEALTGVFEMCCQSGARPLQLQTPKLAETWKSCRKLQFWLRGGKSPQA